jgi:hypothetical protein
MALKKKPKPKMVFTDDSGPAARRAISPDAHAEAISFLKHLAGQGRDEKQKAVAAARAKLAPAVKAAQAAVDELRALVKEHAALVAAAEREVDPATLVAYGLPVHEVNWLTAHIEQAQQLQTNTESTMNRLRADIRQLDHAALNGNAVPTIARDLGYIKGYPSAYLEHVQAISAMLTSFAERLQRRGAGAVMERLIEVRHPEMNPQHVVVETGFDVFKGN